MNDKTKTQLTTLAIATVAVKYGLGKDWRTALIWGVAAIGAIAIATGATSTGS